MVNNNSIHIGKFSLFALIAVAFFVLGVSSASAAGPIVRSGEEVSVEAHQVLEGDFYGFGGAVDLSGEAQHDAYLGGGTVTVNGPVAEDLSVGGGVVQVHGTIGDDVRIVGGDVIIAEPVAGDLVVLAGKVKILSTATIGGDVILLANEAQIDGTVTGSLYGSVGMLRIDAPVGGDVSVSITKSFTLGNAASIDGNVAYKSAADVVRAQGAVVVGDIHKETVILETDTEFMKGVALEVLMLLFASLSLYLIARPRMKEVVSLMEHSYGRQGLIGFSVLIGVPFLAVVLIASVLGAFLGIVVLAAYVGILISSMIISCIVLGSLLTKHVMKRAHDSVLSVVLGATLFGVLSLIPVIGPLIVFILFLMTLGTVSTLVYRALR